jgi:transposase-like protein
MEAMAKHRSHSIEFKRQVAQEFLAGETLRGLANRHSLSRSCSRTKNGGVRKKCRRRKEIAPEGQVQAGLLTTEEGRLGASSGHSPLIWLVRAFREKPTELLPVSWTVS